MLVRNLAFLCALWCPLLVLPQRAQLLRERPLLALLGLQLLVAVIAAKPGAGIHHLLPFIPANALLFAPYAAASRGAGSGVVWLAALLPGLAASLMFGVPMARHWRTNEGAARELAQIQARHPDVVMGVAGNRSYPYAFMRPMLGHNGAPQVDYSSYMDLHLVGVPDTPLRQAFETCRIGHLAVPRGEPPFSLVTYYSPFLPLFSAALRVTFTQRYQRIAEGAWFDTYECRPA